MRSSSIVLPLRQLEEATHDILASHAQAAVKELVRDILLRILDLASGVLGITEIDIHVVDVPTNIN